MELVHKLNPDGVEAEPKIYRHPIPDDKFEELKKGCPEANLTEKPNIYFQYYPLDWLSGDENIQGVAIKLSFDSFFEALVPQAVNMSMGNKTLTQFYICLTGYYVERKYAFVTMLPNDEEADINEFMQNLDTDEYWEFWDSKNEGGEYELVYQFPEFKTEYEASVAPVLIDMGMTDAFDPDRANFSNMGSCPIYIGDVIHKTYIDVNRAGTTAAAATEIEMKCGAALAPDETRYVICDRPFAYAIVDTATGLPVFLGTVETV